MDVKCTDKSSRYALGRRALGSSFLACALVLTRQPKKKTKQANGHV